MKKYLLSLLITGITLIGFSSAESITFTKVSDWDYSPATFTAFDGMTDSISFSCPSGEYCGIRFADENDNWCYITQCNNDSCTTNSDLISYQEYTCVNGNTYKVEVSGMSEIPFSSITFSDGQTGGGSEGGNEGGNEGGILLPGGFSSLTPAFDGLKSSVSQIIPLVIYIGIGILLAVLGFYAIRRLVNWLGKKINSVFRSKRG